MTLLNKYSIDFQKEVVRITLSCADCKFPKYGFYYKHGFNEWSVQLIRKIDKWNFYQNGHPLPFENLSNYKKKNVAARLNNSIIEKYTRALGFDYKTNRFWLSDGDPIEHSLILK